jgi:hypothetical protein
MGGTMLTRTELLRDHRLTDEALADTYRRLFGFPVDLAGEDTVDRQRVRRRALEETGPFLRGEIRVAGESTRTPIPGMVRA